MDSLYSKIFDSISSAKNMIIPTIILGLSLIIYYTTNNLPDVELTFLHYSFFAISGISLLISIYFNYTRAAFSILIIFLNYIFINYLKLKYGTDFTSSSLFFGLCFIIPLNLIIFSFGSEHGVFNKYGILKLVFILIQITLIDFIVNRSATLIHPTTSQDWIDIYDYYLNFKFFDNIDSKILTQPAILVAIIGFFILLVKASFSGSLLDNAFLVSLIIITLTINYCDNPTALTIFSTSALLIISSSVIQNLYYMAYHDNLTGIPSRQSFFSDIKKLPSKYSVAIIDIDNFKKFNDKYGHDIGDDVLVFVANRLAEIEGCNKAYRYGGEEFTVLFPNKNSKTSLELIDEVREDIANSKFYIEDKKKKTEKITISVGLAERKRSDRSIDTVIKRADKALYKAKSSGKNKTIKSN